MPDGLPTLFLIVFPALAIVAALSDATTMTIPNWISAVLVLAFFPAALIVGLTPAAIGLSAALAFGALVAGMVMFALRWIGGGALALALLSARRMASTIGVPFPQPAWLQRLLAPEGDIPYGIAIAAGALVAFPQSVLVAAVHGAA